MNNIFKDHFSKLKNFDKKTKLIFITDRTTMILSLILFFIYSIFGQLFLNILFILVAFLSCCIHFLFCKIKELHKINIFINDIVIFLSVASVFGIIYILCNAFVLDDYSKALPSTIFVFYSLFILLFDLFQQ